MTDPGPISFDEYCELHGIEEPEYGAAFAAYLHEISGGKWDGQVRKVEDD
jgi:hypothetical protein